MRTDVTFPSAGLELAAHLAAPAGMRVVHSTDPIDTWPAPAERAL